jgi:hypothetical protein
MSARVIFRFFIVYVAMGAFVSCTSDVSLVSSPELLEKFHKAYITTAAPQKSIAPPRDGEADFYMDFSGSMHEGIERSATLIDHLLTVFDPSISEGYAVHGSVERQDLLSMLDGQGKPFFVKSVDNYHHDTSRLDLAIDRIVAKGRTAVFLTDFRKEDGTKSKEACGTNGLKTLNYYNSPWAHHGMEKWLQAGHRITIYSSHEFGSSSTKYSPRLFLILFVRQNDTTEQSVSSRVARLFAKDRTVELGSDWPMRSPVEFQLQDGYLSFPESSQRKNHGLREGLACRSSIHNTQLHYSYFRFDRGSLVSSLKQDSVLTMDLSMPSGVVFGEPQNMKIVSYDITRSFEEFALYPDSVFKPRLLGSLLDTIAQREGWSPVDWFVTDDNAKGLSSDVKLFLPSPGRLPIEKTLFQINILCPKHYLKIPTETTELLKWHSDGCEMRALTASLAASLQKSPVPEWVRYTIYVEILN